MRYDFEIEKDTIIGVCNWYELQNICNWVIYSKQPENVKYVGCENEAESLEKLNYALNDIKNSPSVVNPYILQCRSKNPKETKLPIIKFCLNKNTQNNISGVNPGYATKQDIEEIKSLIQADDIENEINELEPEPQNFISGLLQNTEIQQAVINGITYLISSYSKKPIVTSLAGFDTIELVYNDLQNKGVKLEHLRKLADMPVDKIKMLINML